MQQSNFVTSLIDLCEYLLSAAQAASLNMREAELADNIPALQFYEGSFIDICDELRALQPAADYYYSMPVSMLGPDAEDRLGIITSGMRFLLAPKQPWNAEEEEPSTADIEAYNDEYDRIEEQRWAEEDWDGLAECELTDDIPF